jgi:predicted regulator of Ras-like GTPase activity (Roadblock/LC7/MglB family)
MLKGLPMVDDIDRQLTEALRGLRRASPHVVGTAVVTGDGFVVASDLPDENYEKKVTIMAMAMLTMGQEATDELGSTDVERVLVESHDSYIVMVNAGPSAVLAAVASREMVLGLLFVAMKETAAEISSLLY